MVLPKDLWASPPDFTPDLLGDFPISKYKELFLQERKWEDYSEIIPGTWRCNGCRTQSKRSGLIDHDNICPVHFDEIEGIQPDDPVPLPI